ncbi:MAG: 1,4-dihydroxy-2-naphthoate polyprenyltransferase [Deltaproteobacteria bacterium]|nr:1,4-dihydroxy-2-naphthoate polyprenyltransferase [Deltaproteobacteria bacterium]
MSEVRPGSLQAWVLASRPRTLPVSLGPVLVGTAVASSLGGLRMGPAIAAGLGALLLQIGSNFANDVFDHEKGADTEYRLGPLRAAQAGLLSPRALKIGMLVVFGLATLVGVYLATVAGPAIIVVGLVSIAAAIAYTGGPWPLGYHGLGDVAVFLFFGLVAVVGTTFVQTTSLPPLAWMAALPVGGLATAILVVNNLRDIESDARAGKHTLAVRLGRGGARLEWAGLVAGSYLLVALPWLLLDATPWVLLPWLTTPRAFSLWRVLREVESGPELNEALAGTAQLGFLVSLLFAIGLWV